MPNFAQQKGSQGGNAGSFVDLSKVKMYQIILSYLLLAAAVAYLAFRFLGRRKKEDCEKDCNCG